MLSLGKFDIPAWPISNLRDLQDAYMWITKSVEAKHFQTCCLDSVSEIGEVVLAAAKKTNKDPRAAYGELIDSMMGIMRSFRDLPQKHVYFSAKLEVVKDDMSGALKNQPSMPGTKLGPALPYLFDEVFHMGTAKNPDGTEYRYLRTALDFQYEAKDRSGTLDQFERPDLTHIFNKILSGASK